MTKTEDNRKRQTIQGGMCALSKELAGVENLVVVISVLWYGRDEDAGGALQTGRIWVQVSRTRKDTWKYALISDISSLYSISFIYRPTTVLFLNISVIFYYIAALC